MKFQLNKWYFDITTETETGYYYIMSLQIGPCHIGGSEIYHFSPQSAIHSFSLSGSVDESIHRLHLANATVKHNFNTSKLNIQHKDLLLTGEWTHTAKRVKRVRKPLYQNNHGWCDWKVWAPHSQVTLEIIKNGDKLSTSGTGYVDYVRFAFPFWKIPFKELYWGRLHGESSWMVFFSLRDSERCLSLFYNPEYMIEDVGVAVKKNLKGEIEAFDWTVQSDDEKRIYHIVPQRCLEDQDILFRQPILKLLPMKTIRRISSYGRDKKYQVSLQHKGKNYRGIMEEVTWLGQ